MDKTQSNDSSPRKSMRFYLLAATLKFPDKYEESPQCPCSYSSLFYISSMSPFLLRGMSCCPISLWLCGWLVSVLIYISPKSNSVRASLGRHLRAIMFGQWLLHHSTWDSPVHFNTNHVVVERISINKCDLLQLFHALIFNSRIQRSNINRKRLYNQTRTTTHAPISTDKEQLLPLH